MNEVRAIEQEMVAQFNTRIAQLEAQMQAADGTSNAATGTADRFHVVTLNRGQTLRGSVGVEIMLRIGTATATGSMPALVNYTSGTTLSSGSELMANHMYLVTIDGNGLTATADTVRVLVRGNYTIS